VDVDEAADISSQSMLETFGRESRRELFLDEMKLVVPWAESGALIEPHHAKAGTCGVCNHAADLFPAA
jgi:hypothetical protein